MSRRHFPAGFPCTVAGRLGVTLLLVILAGTARLGAQVAAPPAPEAPVVRSISQYWNLSAEAKSRPIDVELVCHVTYFDAQWRMLFVQDEAGDAAYVPYGDNGYPFKVGESIIARGQFIPPSLDVSFEHVAISPHRAPAPTPVPVTEEITNHQKNMRKLVLVEGIVDWMRRVDDLHLQLALSVNGQNVGCWVQMAAEEGTPDLLDHRIRVEGVYNSKVGPDGQLDTLEILVPSVTKITSLGRLAEEPAFNLPPTQIGNLLGRPSDQMVRVVGAVVAREPGKFVRIRDGSGQIDLMTGQMRPLAVNDVVEAIGYPLAYGPSWRLQGAVFRSYVRTVAAEAHKADGALGLAADVLALSAEEAASGRPVRLTGVVTWSHTSSPFFFIADSSGGIRVMRGNSKSPVRSPGRNVEVTGVTAMGPFAPVVVASHFTRVSEAILPMARQVSVEHAMSGVEEGQWVEMRGYLRRVHRDQGWNRLELATGTSDFTAMLPPTEDVSAMIGSVIRLHGICAAEADAQRKLTGITLWVPGMAYVQVDEPAPEDPFTVPLRPVASLGQFETVQSFNRRVRVTGTVLHHAPGNSLWLEEGGHSLLVLTDARERLEPGERIEAVGFLGRQGGRVALREAVLRGTGARLAPSVRALDPDQAPTAETDGRLVAIEGLLLDNVQIGGNARYIMQAGATIFSATLDNAHPEVLADGSRIRLTGVHELEFDQAGRPTGFGLRLRTPADVAVLETPSWWTRGRILTFTSMLALGVMLFVGWTTVLRRQVRRQTGQIREQMEREARLHGELARAGKLESLGLLAGGIAHDFNNLLTVLIGNISLIRLDGGLTGESAQSLDQAAKAAARARDLTQQLLTFAKGGSPLRAAVSLPEIVKEVAEFATRGSKVSCRFDLPADLWPANVDKGQVGQVVQNIVINAIQAMPDGGRVDVALSNQQVDDEFEGVLAPGRYLRVDIRDHGPGIPQADLTRIFDPYFTTKQQGSGLGLATVHSIVKKHAGHITVDAAPGQGTTFHVWLPAAEAGAVPRSDSVHPAPKPDKGGGARVLVMDDEQFIRDLAGSILKRHGCAVTTVADGAAALREYARGRDDGAPYNLVILDLTIPGGMGGRQTMEELLRLDPGVRAIVSSGYSNDLVLANYQAHGFRGMISKPYDVADFIDTVDRVMRGERA
jgi:signal transduction histidine kinase/ActR/RegA family two-component response regulator